MRLRRRRVRREMRGVPPSQTDYIGCLGTRERRELPAGCGADEPGWKRIWHILGVTECLWLKDNPVFPRVISGGSDL